MMEKNSKRVDVMLDLESMSTRSYGALVGIAATIFSFDDEEIEIYSEFHENISLQSSLDAGLSVEGRTIMWWMEQSDEARQSLINPEPKNLSHVLYLFTQWFENYAGKSAYVWGNSNRFDCGLLADAYHVVGKEIPWDFRKEEDVRTLSNLYPDIRRETEFRGIPHNPLDDCKHQIKYCKKVWDKIYG